MCVRVCTRACVCACACIHLCSWQEEEHVYVSVSMCTVSESTAHPAEAGAAMERGSSGSNSAGGRGMGGAAALPPHLPAPVPPGLTTGRPQPAASACPALCSFGDMCPLVLSWGAVPSSPAPARAACGSILSRLCGACPCSSPAPSHCCCSRPCCPAFGGWGMGPPNLCAMEAALTVGWALPPESHCSPPGSGLLPRASSPGERGV